VSLRLRSKNHGTSQFFQIPTFARMAKTPRRLLLNDKRFYYGLFVVLLLPALLINLGVHHLFVHTDESRRALVALEMILSGNYIVPTLNGQLYFNKPPLYNWIIAASFKLFGAYSAFALRFPVVISLIAYAWLVRKYLKPILGNAQAWLVLIATVTCGRILFYDSFLGLIDITFSALIFLNFMLFYVLSRQRRYYLLFCVSYLVVAVTYLMKGLPPLVFQFFTVIGTAIFLKKWKFIFHPAHFVGFLFFLVPVGVYYWFYLDANPQSLTTLVETIWTESSKRTVTNHGVLDMVKEIAIFPFENIYHFLPWTVLVVCLFSLKTLRSLWQQDFMRYAIIVFLLNILVYWTSPGVHPRYLFMFLPLLFAVFWQAYAASAERLKKGLQVFLGAIMTLGIALPVVLYFKASPEGISGFEAKLVVSLIALVLIVILYWRKPAHRWLILASFLLIVRICFNWILLPNRDAKGQHHADGARKVVELTEGKPLSILGPNWVHNGTSFMISRGRGEILHQAYEASPGEYYIVVEGYYSPEKFQSFLEFTSGGSNKSLYLVKLR
jgi:4-amino-4-deoxy-L-arabinose transferase-like glycosyltransferase